MAAEIPIWVNNSLRWVTGVTRRTTCEEVIKVLLEGENVNGDEVKEYSIMERWRRVERPLDDKAKILKVWCHWGDEQNDVRFTLKKTESEADSGRGSPTGGGYISSMRRRKNRSRVSTKQPWSRTETLHPKRLAELGGYNRDEYEEYQLRRMEQSESKDSRYHEQQHRLTAGKHADKDEEYVRKRGDCCGGTGILHSTLLPDKLNPDPSNGARCCKKKNKHKRNSENIEKLMKLILAQGATIQNQLQRLKDREDQIDYLEHERHRERLEKDGRNYLLETYLGSLGEAIAPGVSDEEKGNDSGVHTEGGSDQMNPAWNTEMRKETERRLKDGIKEEEGRSRSNKTQECKEDSKREKRERPQRSKSEGRTKESENDICTSRVLKRTKSENTLAKDPDSANINKNEITDRGIGQTKDQVDESVEIAKIQSQLDLWEKVLRINKKLEKEEETLVRLHIKIRKFQAESLKYAKEPYKEEGDKEDKEGDLEPTEYNEMRFVLENLRKELDHNSREIYENFTKLINRDQEATKKQCYLHRVEAELKIMEEQEQLLTNILCVHTKSEAESTVLETKPTGTQDLPDIGLSIQVKGQEMPIHGDLTSNVMSETPLTSIKRQPLSHKNLLNELAETPTINEESQLVPKSEAKSKTVKISFGDEIKNSDIEPQEIVDVKEPAPANTPAKKGILKNKQPTHVPCTGEVTSDQINDLKKYPVDHNINISNGCEGSKPPWKTDVETTQFSNDSVHHTTNINPLKYQPSLYPINGNTYHNPIYGTAIQEDKHYDFISQSGVGNIYATRRVLLTPGLTNQRLANKNNFQPTTVITTKAQVHNDTDSSNSSETSGLSSMNSNSPIAEEHYSEGIYVLDTLV